MIGAIPQLTAVEVANLGVLVLSFADVVCGHLDRMRPAVFDRARTPSGFHEAALDPESGTVTWPGGPDLAPDTLFERVRLGRLRLTE